MTKLAVFDLDGTLIDSLNDIALAVNHTRICAGLTELDTEGVKFCIGNGVDTLIDRAIPKSAMAHDEAKNIFKEFYSRHAFDKTCLYPNVANGLKKLQDSGVLCCVVSNKPDTATKQILEHFGVSEYFVEIAGGSSRFPLKPAPDALLYLKEKYNADKCFMCGDHYTDLECGRRANFTTILAKYGFGDPRCETPDASANNFDAVTEIIMAD